MRTLTWYVHPTRPRMIDEADWSRLARYFAGECSPDEAAATRQWLAADPARAPEADALRRMWNAAGVPPTAANTNTAWQRLSARMQVMEGASPMALHQTPTGPVRSRRSFRWRPESSRIRLWTLAAASLVLVAGAAAWWESNERLSSRIEKRIAERAAPDREFRTVRGQRAVVVLGDGSRVELGAESMLRVRTSGTGVRELFLEGQAVFDVVHDTAHPLLVHAKNAVTEDIGTRFSVRAYPGDARVQVFVTAGKVNLRAAGAPVASGTLLGPLDLGVLDSIGRTTVRNGVDSTSHLAWTRDRFVFSNAPLADVLPDVARWFDVRIAVRDSAVARQRITLSVPARSLSEVLGAATVPLGLHFVITGRTVVIR